MSSRDASMHTHQARETPAGTRYWRAGHGPSVVLIHGVGLDATIWSAQFAALAERYDVIAYDMLGHGASPRPPSGCTLEDYAAQTCELMDALQIDTAAIVGFSMGGLVARLMALDHPQRCWALVILASVFERSPSQVEGVGERLAQVRAEGPAANVDSAIERWFSPAYRATHPQAIARIRDMVASNDPDGYTVSYALFGSEHNVGRDRLSQIDVPVLVATGDDDPGSTPAMARRLSQRLANAECRILPAMRHMFVMEHPRVATELIANFLTIHHSAHSRGEMQS